jgi:hypothetical protein
MKEVKPKVNLSWRQVAEKSGLAQASLGSESQAALAKASEIVQGAQISDKKKSELKVIIQQAEAASYD